MTIVFALFMVVGSRLDIAEIFSNDGKKKGKKTTVGDDDSE